MFFCYICALIGVFVDALAGSSSDELVGELVGALVWCVFVAILF